MSMDKTKETCRNRKEEARKTYIAKKVETQVENCRLLPRQAIANDNS